MIALAWLRAQRRKPKPTVPSGEALHAALTVHRVILEPVDLAEFGARLSAVLSEAGVTIRPKPEPGGCICCFGRYSTCRNLT